MEEVVECPDVAFGDADSRARLPPAAPAFAGSLGCRCRPNVFAPLPPTALRSIVTGRIRFHRIVGLVDTIRLRELTYFGPPIFPGPSPIRPSVG